MDVLTRYGWAGSGAGLDARDSKIESFVSVRDRTQIAQPVISHHRAHRHNNLLQKNTFNSILSLIQKDLFMIID